ncbi:MAG: hypothetical protein IKJ19_06350 [Clostridia bacterium]|nr:hypothetical protein [Clostridia bacterium]
MADKKEKKFLIDNPTLMAEWNWEKNNELGLDPKTFTCGSEKKVWWKCGKGHEWQAIIYSRNNGNGCPYCSGNKILIGYNDLLTINPKLSSEWNYEKNGDLKPEDFTVGSNKKVWWKCKKGHEWQATIAHRNNGSSCPFCAGQKVIKGYNDLETLNPTLAKEWNHEKNGELKPEDFMPNSNKKVWWKCDKGHEWQATIGSRSRGNGCPGCSSERSTSFPEYAVLFYLKKNGLKAIHRYKERGYELDIYIPSRNIAIEYDGYFWHKNTTKKDLAKNLKCKNGEIKLYRIREGLPSLNDYSIDYIIDKNQKYLEEVLQKVLSEIVGFTIYIGLDRDTIAIESLREYSEKSNSLLFINPTLAQEWNYEKNGSLKPEHILANSNKKVWWKCRKGHEWQATISHRNYGYGCPYCYGRYAIKGETDLATINPKLVKEWHYEKNGNLKPEDFMPNSNKKVWWKCEKGHEWQALISDRNKGKSCPICSNKKILIGYNDLATTNPKLASEWNYDKNDDLKPEDFTANSEKKVWWKCDKGHVWQATIASRNSGKGCPYCSGRYVIKGVSDLATINPKLASEWNYEKNSNLRPEDFTANSHKKVWWKCEKGHEWQATIASRNSGRDCPYCSGRYAIKGVSDLATINPKLVKEWNFDRNGDLKPEDFMANSGKKVWWKCEKGHEWQATIASRNHGSSCPYCSGRNKLNNENNLT